MKEIDKLISLKEKFLEFVNGLEAEFSNIKDASKKISTNSTDDVNGSAKKLQELSDLTLLTVKKKKDETFVEKARVTQQVMNQYSNNGMSASYDVSNNLRNLIQKNINHFELSYNETASKFSKPVIGSLWTESSEWLNQINESTIHELHRSHEVHLSIATDTTESVLSNLQKSLVLFAENDVTALTQKVKAVQQETKEYLESYLIKDYSPNSPKFEFTKKYEELIRSCLRIETPYQGNYTKKNFRSMIFEMRSFSMMFLLLLSSFGINQYIAKNESAKQIVFICSLTLIVVGILVSIAKAQDVKDERLEDEIKKARERIYSEIKRAVSEFISEWKNFILSHFKTEMADISAETDRLIREDTKKKSENVMAERLKLNQLSQVLDTKDRNYQELLRKCESWKLQIDSLSNELQKSTLINN
jgi:hypothetical protein